LQAFGLPREEVGDEPTTQIILYLMDDAKGEENFLAKSDRVESSCNPEYKL
jgi:hypothetical protein